jgi:uncharacterized OB-fold protein
MVLIATKTASQPSLQFPPAEYLFDTEQVQEVSIGPIGRLYTYTVVHPGKGSEPYALAMVDFELGVRAFGRLIGEIQSTHLMGGEVRVVPFSLVDGTPDYAFELVKGGQV